MPQHPDIHVPASGDVPAYILRRSTRAAHVRLNVTPHEGLVVVVPASLEGFDPANALRDKRAWIEESAARFAERRELLLAEPSQRLPRRVEFPSTGEHWHVSYLETAAHSTSTRLSSTGVLTVRGPADDPHAQIAALNRWLQRAARERLVPWLAGEARRTGASPTRVTVRGQRARWGGCTPSGSITLNRCLLFLGEDLVTAAMLHELAHLQHPDHSPAFWRRLAALDPHWEEHRTRIAESWDAVPLWAEPALLQR